MSCAIKEMVPMLLSIVVQILRDALTQSLHFHLARPSLALQPDQRRDDAEHDDNDDQTEAEALLVLRDVHAFRFQHGELMPQFAKRVRLEGAPEHSEELNKASFACVLLLDQ